MIEVTMGIAHEGSHALVQLVNGTGHFGTSYVKTGTHSGYRTFRPL